MLKLFLVFKEKLQINTNCGNRRPLEQEKSVPNKQEHSDILFSRTFFCGSNNQNRKGLAI